MGPQLQQRCFAVPQRASVSLYHACKGVKVLCFSSCSGLGSELLQRKRRHRLGLRWTRAG